VSSASAAPRPAPQVEGLRAYAVPGYLQPIDLNLARSEPIVPSESMLAFREAVGHEQICEYPNARPLQEKLAARLGIGPDRVHITAGADEAIDRLCRAYLAPGREIVVPAPTFEMIPHYAKLAGATVKSFPWPGATFPVEEAIALCTPATAVVAVVSPSNPTGAVVPPEALERLSKAAPQAVLLVDLAYGEFADVDLTPHALKLPNAVVARTLSKAWGLPGLRVGFAAGPAEILSWMKVAGGPYSVSRASIHVAVKRIEQGDRGVVDFIDLIRGQRHELEALLGSLGAEVLPSQANFVYVRHERAAWVRDALAGVGIGVRTFPNDPSQRSALRMTCPGDRGLFDKLCSALRSSLRPEAILFDMDGVLADVSQSYRQAIIETAAAYGVAISGDDITAAKAQGNANNDWELTRRLLAERGVEKSLAEVTERFEALYQGSEGKPGLRATEKLLCEPALLERLSSKLPLAIVTGRPRADAERFLEEKGLRRFFQVVVTMEDGPLKPDPASVQLALKKLGVSHGWMVGDTPDDIRAARGAGAIPLGVCAPGDAADVVGTTLLKAGAARVLERLATLEELLP